MNFLQRQLYANDKWFLPSWITDRKWNVITIQCTWLDSQNNETDRNAVYGNIPGFHILEVKRYLNAGCQFNLYNCIVAIPKMFLFLSHNHVQNCDINDDYSKTTWTNSNSIFPTCDCHVTNDNVIMFHGMIYKRSPIE